MGFKTSWQSSLGSLQLLAKKRLNYDDWWTMRTRSACTLSSILSCTTPETFSNTRFPTPVASVRLTALTGQTVFNRFVGGTQREKEIRHLLRRHRIPRSTRPCGPANCATIRYSHVKATRSALAASPPVTFFL